MITKPLHELMAKTALTDDELRFILDETGKALKLLRDLGPDYRSVYRGLQRDRYTFELFAQARNWPPQSYVL